MKRSALLAFALMLASRSATADVVVIAAAKDNTLWNDLSGGTSSGQGPGVFAGRSGFMGPLPIRRGLIAFDVAGAIPAGARIEAVELTLHVLASSSAQRPVELRRVLADWGEGRSASMGGGGAPAAPGDATWLHTFFPASFWSAPGGDFAAAASATITPTATGAQTWGPTAALAADVQAWLDRPAQNFGWILLGDEAVSFSVKSFHSRESPTVAARPVLRVTFSPPAPTVYCTAKPNSCGTLPAIFAAGSSSATATSGFVVGVGRTRAGAHALLLYTDSGRAPAPVPFHGGLLCLEAGLLGRSVVVADGAGTPGACDGVAVLDMNAFAAGRLGGDPLPQLRVPGTRIDCQYFGRDRFGYALVSNALSFEVGR